MRNKAVFFDLDGTVRGTKSGAHYPKSPEDQVLLPGRKEKIKSYKDQGYKIFAVSNQGGVASGNVTHEAVKSCLYELNHELDGVFDEMAYCPAHEDSGDWHRKPNPGMILDLAKRHDVHLEHSIMVGDLDTDREAAEKAGVPFQHASDFFK